ncbi:MAG: sensor histidine kinase [Gammaproteobacteria bacterium]
MAGNTTRPEYDRVLTESFAEITNSLPEPHFLLDQYGCIISTNQAARKKFSVDTVAAAELNLNTLITDEPDRLNELLQMWSRSKSPLPASVTFKNGGDAPVHYLCRGNTIRPAMNGQSALIMMHCTDKQKSSAVFITLNEKIEQLKREVIERRNAEQEVRRLNQELEQRVNERTIELQTANTELNRSLEELNSAQDQLVRTEHLASLGRMVAGVAHEINTPVGVCLTAASYLDEQTRHYHKLYEEGTLTRVDFESFLDVSSESFQIILANLERASDLVRSFKQLAVDQTSDECRHINMKSYIEELLISLRPYFRHTSHRYELTCPEDIDIESQPGAIAQIINNLIGNSMTHGFEGLAEGLINIEIARDQDRILLHYSDNGVGIPRENLLQIFDPFFTTRRNQGGSGLGMNIVYNLVTSKLGGEINVTSEPGQGVHFYIWLPVLTEA